LLCPFPIKEWKTNWEEGDGERREEGGGRFSGIIEEGDCRGGRNGQVFAVPLSGVLGEGG